MQNNINFETGNCVPEAEVQHVADLEEEIARLKTEVKFLEKDIAALRFAVAQVQKYAGEILDPAPKGKP